MSKCQHDPMQYAGTPMGMYHCPECGEMVLAGMPHPDYKEKNNVRVRQLSEEELADLRNKFSYHPPFGTQVQRYEQIRNAAHDFALFVLENTPKSREQSLFLTQLQLAVMLANMSIACNEKPEPAEEEQLAARPTTIGDITIEPANRPDGT